MNLLVNKAWIKTITDYVYNNKIYLWKKYHVYLSNWNIWGGKNITPVVLKRIEPVRIGEYTVIFNNSLFAL